LDQPLEAIFRDSYPQLLALARARLARENAPISTGTLAHELYLNLRQRTDLKFASTAQFMAYASRAMRSLLVDMARERLAQKRFAELLPLTLGAEVPDLGGTPEQMVALDEALTKLGAVDERLMRVAEMRVIMGMEVAEVAKALEISEPTVKRDWQRAKAYIYETLAAVR